MTALEGLGADVLRLIEDAAARGAARGVREELARERQYQDAHRALVLPEPQLLLAKEAARLLGIGVPALDKRLQRGLLPREVVVGSGKARRFRRDLVLALKVRDA